MYSKIRKLSLVTALCLFAVSLSGATVMLASAEEQNYYVCFSSSAFSLHTSSINSSSKKTRTRFLTRVIFQRLCISTSTISLAAFIYL